MREARRLGVEVTGATVEDGKVTLQFARAGKMSGVSDSSEPRLDSNPWDAEAEKLRRLRVVT